MVPYRSVATAMAPKLDCMVLVSGDGDFVPLIQTLKRTGCRTEVVSFEQSTSNELMREANQFIPIGQDVLFKEEKFVRQMRERRAGNFNAARRNDVAAEQSPIYPSEGQ